jgi:hypothetical protein
VGQNAHPPRGKKAELYRDSDYSLGGQTESDRAKQKPLAASADRRAERIKIRGPASETTLMKLFTSSWGLALLLPAFLAGPAPSCRADSTTLALDTVSASGYTGTLTVSLSAGDWTGANWAFGGSPLGASLTVPGAAMPLNLGMQLVSGTPGQLYLSGSEGAAGAAASDFIAPPVTGASGPTSTDTALSFQTLADGFYVPLVWNGDTDSWFGTWQVTWAAQPVNAADTAGTAALLFFSLAGLAGFRRRRPRATAARTQA